MCVMGTKHKDTLIELKLAFELIEDWVSVGHVEYLLERLAELEVAVDRPEATTASNNTLH